MEEEEVNEQELEEQFYSMLHYVDQTQVNVNTSQDALALIENAPRSTVRRYWRTSDDNASIQRENNRNRDNGYQRDNTTNYRANIPYQRDNTVHQRDNTTIYRGNIPYQRDNIPYQKENSMHQKDNTTHQKVNTPKETPNIMNNNKTKPKEEKRDIQEPLPVHLSFLQSPMPQNMKNTIEIIEHDETGNVVELDTSDEDEVIEVALPPKPTITIESSDEDEPQKTPLKSNIKPSIKDKSVNNDREISTSPVPSIVSSISDEFIRSDCIALNISSRCSDNHSFDFSLHGADLIGQSTPSKKKKKKKNKEATSTPIAVTPDKSANVVAEECFATPKSKAKNKKQKSKSYSVTEKSIPSADVYDSDSNQSLVLNPFAVTNVNLPNTAVCESDSSPLEVDKSKQAKPNVDNVTNKQQEEVSRSSKSNSTGQTANITIVDLTENPLSDESATDIQENIVIGNVTGFPESDDYGDTEPQTDITKYCSTRVPAILYDNLDFDNLKGKDKVCKNRRYSLTSLRAEMEKFYNESWGGEEFNHHEIQRNMSRDKRLWAIDPKDRMPPSINRKNKPICNYCNRYGHRDETCFKKPSVCYMCGSTGHVEPRCPSKICVNCGSPNYMYSTMCRNCSTWGRLKCAECGQVGHPSSHCPDVWRRYHNTIEFSNRLEENRFTKKYAEMFCSGCTRRGHFAHVCRVSLPFSGLPINSPYVQMYRPIYIDNQQNMYNRQRPVGPVFPQDSTVSSATTQFRGDRNKRQSKSPTVHESPSNKKRHLVHEIGETQNPKSPVNPPRKISESKEPAKETEDTNVASETPSAEKAPDFIPITVNNRDKQGQMIQDNEVSDTSDAVTSARIYVTEDILEKLKRDEGEEWLKETMEKLNVIVENMDIQTFLSIKGKSVDQEAFQAALRDWTKGKANKESAKSDNEADVTIIESKNEHNDLSFASNEIPRNRATVLRKISKALDTLKEDLGEPNDIYEEVTALRSRHEQLLKLKVINPKQLSNSRHNINGLLKKLNMVLLGQAGLADGATHLTELYSLQEKLTNLRYKSITDKLRQEIGLHYHTIFTPSPRNDYGELLETYYSNAKKYPKFKKKRNEKFSIKKMNLLKSIANEQRKRPEKEDVDKVKKTLCQKIEPRFVETKNELLSYRKKLLKAHSNDLAIEKKRLKLLSQTTSYIMSLMETEVNLKTMKKIEKVQAETKTLLNIV